LDVTLFCPSQRHVPLSAAETDITRPEHALSDGPQPLDFREFEKLYTQIRAMEGFMKTL
jgi:3-deoxy-D-manno-octulosonic acid (KDO) 8-phosphate synthase